MEKKDREEMRIESQGNALYFIVKIMLITSASVVSG